ncbi:MAG: ATP-binding protein [Verrucomicrobiota bacterium]
MKIASLEPIDRISPQPPNVEPGDPVGKLTKQVEEQSRVLNQLNDVVAEFFHEFPQHTRGVPIVRSGEDPLIATIRFLVKSLDRQNQTFKKRSQEASTQGESEAAYLASVIHEVRAPIEGIQSLCLGLLDARQTDQAPVGLSSIKDTAKALISIIEDSQQNARKHAAHESAPFCPISVIKEVLMLFGPGAQAKGLELQGFMTEPMPDEVLGDAWRIQQILWGLVNNAIKFTDFGSVDISIEALEQDSDWALCFEVADSGRGMTEDKASKLFRPYSQAEAMIARRFGGGGFGLSIIKALVDQMNGHIDVESALGKGSVFRFHLSLKTPEQAATARQVRPMAPPISNEVKEEPPIESAPAAVVSSSSSGAPNLGENGQSVGSALVVEDDAATQLSTRQALIALGYQVDVVGNGQDAIAAAEAKPYDVVCMDILLPDISGMETSRKIRELNAPTSKARILATTGYQIANERQRYQEAGMDDFLPKPFGVEQLRGKLEGLSLSS